MKHGTLFHKMLVVYAFAFLAAIVFPTGKSSDVLVSQMPQTLKVEAPSGGLLVKASSSNMREGDSALGQDDVGVVETISH